MADIIIYTTPRKLLHKQGKLENDPDKSSDGDYYWEFKNRDLTKKVKVRDKVYFATKGEVKGFFIIDNIKYIAKKTIIDFDCKTWKDIKPIPTTHFQGFKYFEEGSV